MWNGSKAIHRDLSSGNVFYDNKNNSGRLGDLEFVTFYTDDVVYKENSHSLSIQAGTPQFMACQVYASCYLIPTSSPLILDQHLSVPSESSDTLAVPDTPDTDQHSTEVYDDFDPADETPTFLHNPHHDLESVWWLLVWSLLRFHPQSTPHPDRDALYGQLKVFLALFPGTQAKRGVALQSINHDHTSPKVSLIRAAQISKAVASLSRELIAMYTAAPIPTAAFEGVHERALYSLALITRKVAKASIGRLVPVHVTLAELEKGE